MPNARQASKSCYLTLFYLWFHPRCTANLEYYKVMHSSVLRTVVTPPSRPDPHSPRRKTKTHHYNFFGTIVPCKMTSRAHSPPFLPSAPKNPVNFTSLSYFLSSHTSDKTMRHQKLIIPLQFIQPCHNFFLHNKNLIYILSVCILLILEILKIDELFWWRIDCYKTST